MKTKILSKLIKLILLSLCLSLFITTTTFALTCNWQGNAVGCDNTYNDFECWSCNELPDGNDTVVFAGDDDSNCTFDYNPGVTSFTVNSGYSGTINASIFNLATTGDLTLNGGTFTNASASDITVGGALTITGGNVTLNGDLQVNGQSDIGSGGVLNMTSSSDDIVFTGNAQISGGTFTTGTGTYTYTGTYIQSSGTFNGSSAAAIQFNDTSSYSLRLDSGIFTASSGITSINGTFLAEAPSNFNHNNGTISMGGSGNSILNNDSGNPLKNLTINKSAVSDAVTTSGVTDVNGNFNMEKGIFIIGEVTVYVAGNWTINNATASFVPDGNLVILDGANQSISGNTNFYSLKKEITSTDTLTFAANSTTAISNTWTAKGANTNNWLTMKSSSDGTAWNIDLELVDNEDLNYIKVKDSNNISGETITVTSPLYGVDLLGNTDWDFGGALVPEFSTYLLILIFVIGIGLILIKQRKLNFSKT